MFVSYLKNALRNLRVNMRFTIIIVTGFAFAISVCLGIALFIAKEHSYDLAIFSSERRTKEIGIRKANGAIALLIAVITVSWQSWRAAIKNPIEALRYE